MGFTHILAPTDLSDAASHVLRYAFEEASLHGARLTLLHVLHHQPDTEEHYLKGNPQERAGISNVSVGLPTDYDPDTGGRLPTPPAPTPELVRRDYVDEARTQMRDLVPVGYTGRLAVEVVAGSPAQAILHWVAEHAVNLIVMGTHGRTGLRHVVLGSVAEHVVRHAPCPVLTIRYPAD